MKKIMIVDDEKPTRELIKNMLLGFDMELEINIESNNVKTALEQFDIFHPDILLLDIQMPDGNGFDVLRKIDQEKIHVIFITAYQEYAIQAIKFSAVDYILKPIDARELKESIEKALELIHFDQQNIKESLKVLEENLIPQKRKKLVLKTQESNYIVSIDDIIRCESDKNYTFFYLQEGKKILVSKTLKDFDILLSPYNFCRVQQSHLINLNFVDRYDKIDGGSVIMKDNSSVPLSPQKKDIFFKMLEEL
jgi:two-component system LytT family response regulator